MVRAASRKTISTSASALFDGAVATIIATSLVAIVLEGLERFDTLVALIPGLIVGTWVTKALAADGRRQEKLSTVGVVTFLCILGVHLVFRLPTYQHIEGGQDQGLYYSLGALYEREGSDRFEDRISARIAELTPPARADGVAELYRIGGGLAIPGAYPVGDQTHDHRIEFYPLHPLWMAIVGRFAGLDLRASSLTLFSVLGLIATWRLVLIISRGDLRAAGLACLLTSTHPALAFAAKMPYSETVAFAFAATAGFYFARATFSSRESPAGHFDVWLCLGSFGCCALTRPNTVAYLPVLIIALLASVLVNSRSRRLRSLRLVAGLLAIIPASLLYFVVSMPTILGRHIDRVSPMFLLMAGSIALGLLAFGVVLWRNDSVCGHARDRFRALFPVTIAVAIAGLIGWQLWCSLAMFETSRSHWLTYPQMVGVEGFLRSALGRALVLLSPFGSGLLALALVAPRKYLGGARGWLAAIALSVFPVLYWIGFRYSAYSFYYDRYLLSEIVPVSLILIAMVGAKATRDTSNRVVSALVWASLATTISWFTVASLAQLGKNEGPASHLYSRIQTMTESDTLVVLETDSLWHFQAAASALRLELDLDVFPIRSVEHSADHHFREIFSIAERGILLTGRQVPGFELIETVEHSRSFFHDNSKHMTELLADHRPSNSRTDRGWTPDWLAPAIPPVAHAVLEFPIHIYRLDLAHDQSNRSNSFDDLAAPVIFEAERQLTTAEGAEYLTVDEPASTTSAGKARRLELRDFPPHAQRAAIYGQYFPLDAGCHEIEFRLKIDQQAFGPVALLDIAIERGARQLDAVPVSADDFKSRNAYQTFSTRIALDKAVDDAEFRVWYRGTSRLWVDFSKVRQLSGDECSER